MAQANIHEPILDDMTIAQRLLNNPKVPHRSTSLSSIQDGIHSHAELASPSILKETYAEGRSRRGMPSSNTWTSSSGDVLSDQDEVDDRTIFIQEFNRLAKKHGVRGIIPQSSEGLPEEPGSAKTDNWFSRKILRRTSSTQSVKAKNDRPLKHKRSISDLSLRLKQKRDKLKDKDLQELVRLCGSSLLYLPTEYATGSLAVPTCFRATAQYLVQHATNTRGIFRIPGSHNTVAALYSHYCSMDETGSIISGTVRCPTLPEHIRCDVHDVASAFKKFLSGLPGGILGSLSVFDSLISIQNQFYGDAEFTRTKHSKVRARLIALAIATLRSQYRRELICAVFGLLCMIGRAAETSWREDEWGRPLPTSDLMGYGPLGIVFGPLLVGDLLEDYTMRLANPRGGLVLLPISPPKSVKERKKKPKIGEEGSSFNTHVDKIKIANSIAEMVITHWRDVVRHMKSLYALKSVNDCKSLGIRSNKPQCLRPSASESFTIRKPPDWDDTNVFVPEDRNTSPTPTRPSNRPMALLSDSQDSSFPNFDSLTIRKQRPKPRSLSSQRLSGARSLSILSPTIEEHQKENSYDSGIQPQGRNRIHNRSDSSDKENKSPQSSSKHASSVSNKSYTPKLSYRPVHPAPASTLPKAFIPTSNPIERSHVSQNIGHAKCSKPRFSPEKISPLETANIQAMVDIRSIISSRKERALLDIIRSSKVPGVVSSSHSFDLSTTVPKEPVASHPLQVDLHAGFPNKGLVAQVKRSFESKYGHKSQQVESALPTETNHMVMTGRASAKESEGNVSEPQRRLGASDPGVFMSEPSQSPRKISRSLYDDPKRKRNLLDWNVVQRLQSSKDPLSKVSNEEDMASLVDLAQAMVLVDDLETQAKFPGIGAIELPNSRRSDKEAELKVRFFPNSESMSHSREFKPSPSQIKSYGIIDSNQSVLNFELDRNVSSDELGTSTSPAPQLESNTSGLETPKSMRDIKDPVTPTNTILPRYSFIKSSQSKSSPTPSAKFSALVAKFDSPNGTHQSSAPQIGSSKESPLKQVIVDSGCHFESRKGSLIAPYTINSPSPARSQKSGKSEKTPRSNRGPVVVNREQRWEEPISPLKDTSIVQTPSPASRRSGRVLAITSSLEEHTAPLKGSSPITGKTYHTSPKVLKFLDGIATDISTSTPTYSVPPQRDFEPLQPYQYISSTESGSSNHNPTQAQTSQGPSQSIDPSTEMFSPTNFISRPIHISRPSASTELGKFDGPVGFQSIKLLPRPEPPSVAQHLRSSRPPSTSGTDTADFVYPDLTLKENFASSPAGPSGSPNLPSRSNSLLFTQIRNLQKQLSSKGDEVRQLRQQLEARDSLDIGNLSEQLREAKREAQIWKTRAEIAEKQVEMLASLPSRTNSRQTSKDMSSKASNRINPFGTEYGIDETKMAGKIRKALQGLDGATSSHECDSEGSTDTVIHDIKEAITNSDYSIWVEQMILLETEDPQNLD